MERRFWDEDANIFAEKSSTIIFILEVGIQVIVAMIVIRKWTIEWNSKIEIKIIFMYDLFRKKYVPKKLEIVSNLICKTSLMNKSSKKILFNVLPQVCFFGCIVWII